MSTENDTPEGQPPDRTAELIAELAQSLELARSLAVLLDDDDETAGGAIQPPDEPLDPYTLRVVLAELDRRPTTPSEEVVSDLLATANPRARVVVLPEPDAPNGARGKLWRTPPGIRVCTGPDGENLVSASGALMVADDAAQLARAILAAAEFAGGAQ